MWQISPQACSTLGGHQQPIRSPASVRRMQAEMVRGPEARRIRLQARLQMRAMLGLATLNAFLPGQYVRVRHRCRPISVFSVPKNLRVVDDAATEMPPKPTRVIASARAR